MVRRERSLIQASDPMVLVMDTENNIEHQALMTTRERLLMQASQPRVLVMMETCRQSAHGEEGEVVDPGIGAQGAGDETGKGGVAEGEPATGGHSVGLVLELVGPEVHEISEDAVPQDAGVQGRHAIHCVTGHQCKVRHPHKSAQQG